MRDPREYGDEEERVREVAQAERRVRRGQFLRSVERMIALYCQSVSIIRVSKEELLLGLGSVSREVVDEEERVREIAQAERWVRGGQFLRSAESAVL